MRYSSLFIPAIFILVFSSCKNVESYTQIPSTLDYLMEAPAATEKSGESIFVKVDRVENAVGKVENLDVDFLYLIFYIESKVDQVYYLDSTGYKENLRSWTKAAMERELERNSRFTVATHEVEADYILRLDIDSMAAWSRSIARSSDVYVPMGAGYGAIPVTVNRDQLLPNAYGQVNLRYNLTDSSGKSILHKLYNQQVEYSDSNLFNLPLTLLNLRSSCNANAVEHLSFSFQQNFTSILNDLNELPRVSALKE